MSRRGERDGHRHSRSSIVRSAGADFAWLAERVADGGAAGATSNASASRTGGHTWGLSSPRARRSASASDHSASRLSWERQQNWWLRGRRRTSRSSQSGLGADWRRVSAWLTAGSGSLGSPRTRRSRRRPAGRRPSGGAALAAARRDASWALSVRRRRLGEAGRC